MSRPLLELADIIRTAGQRLIDRHLEPEAAASSACSLRRCCRRSVSGPHPLGASPALRFLPPRSSSQRGVPWQIRGGTEGGLRFRTAPLSRPTPRPRSTQAVPEVCPSAFPSSLGGLLQAALRGAPSGAALPRSLHPSWRNLESPLGLVPR